jgi:hypothetical protein
MRHIRILVCVLREYVTFYNERCLQQRLGHNCPVPLTRRPGRGPIHCRNVFGGNLPDCDRAVVCRLN